MDSANGNVLAGTIFFDLIPFSDFMTSLLTAAIST
jgi:hypothetical protein